MTAQRVEKLESVEPRHHHVAQDQVRAVPYRGLKCLLAVGDRFDLVTVAEQAADMVAHVGVIISKQDATFPCERTSAIQPDIFG